MVSGLAAGLLLCQWPRVSVSSLLVLCVMSHSFGIQISDANMTMNWTIGNRRGDILSMQLSQPMMWGGVGAFHFILFVLCGIENMDLFHKFTIPINPLPSLSLGLVLTFNKINQR